jgi:hypothetical protein
MEKKPPGKDYLTDLEPGDITMVYTKVKGFSSAPWLIRFGLLGVFLLFVFFAVGTDTTTLIFWLAVAAFAGMWGLAEWGLRMLLRRLKADLKARKKRVVEGELEAAIPRGSSKGRKSESWTPIWVIDGVEFQVDRAGFRVASVGDYVRLEMLPTSGIVFRQQAIPLPKQGQ